MKDISFNAALFKVTHYLIYNLIYQVSDHRFKTSFLSYINPFVMNFHIKYVGMTLSNEEIFT